MKRPAFQVYPADWRKDVELQSCSITARGVWWELCCLMHECRPYGHLSRNGAPIPDEGAANLIRVPVGTYRKSLAELEMNGVPSRLIDGTVYSRRMVKDEHIRNMRAQFGKLGGNPDLLKAKDNHTDEDKVNQAVKPKVKAESTPSSSSSSSSKAKSKTKAARKRAIPPDFSISDSVRDWAEDKGYTDLAVYLEHFVGRNTASGKEYLDWDQTFMNAIREDWYGVRKGGNGHQRSGRESRVEEQERVLGSLTGYDPKRTIDGGH